LINIKQRLQGIKVLFWKYFLLRTMEKGDAAPARMQGQYEQK
jgi:hypothetical protein